MRAGPPGGAVVTSSEFSLGVIGITALTEGPGILSDGRSWAAKAQYTGFPDGSFSFDFHSDWISFTTGSGMGT